MPKKIFKSSFIQVGCNQSNLFKTRNFCVNVNRDNQAVPGILQITTIYNLLNDWDNWQREHWIELLQTIRLCELTLIVAFEPNRDPKLKPTQDNKLINCYGKNRRINGKSIIYFDIVPRYKERIQLRDLLSLEKSEVSEEELEPFKTDNLYGKPFNFDSPIKPSDKIYNSIVMKLLATINQNDFSKYLLEDNFATKDSCIACVKISEHPHATGIVEIAGFKIALDARSQEERGRVFCDTIMHVPALRYWEDEWMADLGKIFAAYRSTVSSLYKTENNREFDWMCLMNLAKEQEGPHTHIHFIPRTAGGKDYGCDFSMDKSTYKNIEEIAIVEGTTKEAIVKKFRKELNKNLKKEEIMVIKSEHDEQQLLLQKIEKLLNDISQYKSDTKKNREKKAIAHGFVLNYVKCIKSTEKFSDYRNKIIKQLSEVLKEIINKDLLAPSNIHNNEDNLFKEINAFIIDLYENRNNQEKIDYTIYTKFVNKLEYNIKELFHYCFSATNYGHLIHENAVLILGSFATGMATLYSDIEYFILIRDEEHKNSCRRAAYLFNTIIKSLGENKDLLDDMHDIFNSDYDEIAQYANKNKGLSIDASKNPFNDDLFCEFVNTPKKLLEKLLSDSNYTRHELGNHTTSALLTTKFLSGNEELYNQYKKMFINYLSKKEYFDLIISLLKMDLNINIEFGERLTFNEKTINVKSILANIIHIIRGLYLLHKSYDLNDDLESNFFTMLEILKEKLSIEESRYQKWMELIQNIYKLRLSLQSERKSADITIKDLKNRLHNENIESILRDISSFVKSKFDEISNSFAETIAKNLSQDVSKLTITSNESQPLLFSSPSTQSEKNTASSIEDIEEKKEAGGTLEYSPSKSEIDYDTRPKSKEPNVGNYSPSSVDYTSEPKEEENSHDIIYYGTLNSEDTKSQIKLGIKYYYGKDGVTLNYCRAANLFNKAANQNCRVGQFNLGNCFYHGHGVDQDYTTAVDWYTKAAKQGETDAQNMLGNCYKKGKKGKKKRDVVHQSLKMAFYWFEEAAKGELAAAQFNLGACYQNGEGVTKDDKQAVYWYSKAANQNHSDAQYYLGLCYEKGYGVDVVDIRQAEEFYRTAATNNHQKATKRLKEKFSKTPIRTTNLVKL